MVKKRDKEQKIPRRFLHLSYITALIAFIGSLTLFFIQPGATVLLLFLPIFVMGAIIFAVIDFVLIAQNPRLLRKLPPILSVILGVIAFILYIIGLGRLA